MLGCDDILLSSFVYFRKFLRNLLEIGLVFGSKQKCTFLFFTHTQFIRQNTLSNRNKNKSISISSDSKNGEINCNNKGIRCSDNKLSRVMLTLLKVISSLPHKASHFHGSFSISWTYCSRSFVSVPIEILFSNYKTRFRTIVRHHYYIILALVFKCCLFSCLDVVCFFFSFWRIWILFMLFNCVYW